MCRPAPALSRLAGAACLWVMLSIYPRPASAVEFLNYTAPLPNDWIAEQPGSSMRVLQYRVPGSGDGADAQFILYYFGPGQGGSPEANIARWRGQFSSAEDPVVPRVERFLAGEMSVTTVELRGDYARGVGMGPVGEAKPDQILLAGIVAAPEGNLIAQLHGPAQTVGDRRRQFLHFLRQIEPRHP